MSAKGRKVRAPDPLQFSEEEQTRAAYDRLEAAQREHLWMGGPGWKKFSRELRKTADAFDRVTAEWGDREWAAIREGVDGGTEPTKAEILYMIRHFGVPRDMGKYVESRLRQAKNAPGRPRDAWFNESRRVVRAWNLAWDVALKEHWMHERGAQRTRQRAIEETARERNITVRALRSLLKDGKEKFLALPGRSWPSRALVARFLSGAARIPGSNLALSSEMIEKLSAGGREDGYLLTLCGRGEGKPAIT